MTTRLHGDLLPHVRDTGIMRMVHHKLIVTTLISVEHCPEVNDLYEHKKKMLNKAIEDSDWSSYLMLHERPYRFEALFDIKDVVSQEDYWAMVGTVWRDSENIWEHYVEWRGLWRASPEMRYLAMTVEDREAFGLLPNRFPVYRGTQWFADEKAMSWTTSLKTAQWFANRFKEPGRVYTAKVDKDKVYAYFTGRNESEIVVEISDLIDVERVW